MHITIFGSTGRVGQLLVSRALAQGHSVTAFTHSRPGNFPQSGVTICQGDIHDAASVARALDGSDAALSALSSWGTRTKDIQTAAMRSIIPVMQQKGIRRIVSVTGSDARAPGDSLSLIHRLSHAGIGIVAGRILADGENHIGLLADSGLDWTVIRSPVMLADGHDDAYTLSDRRPFPTATIPRPCVADAMIAVSEDRTHIVGAPFIHRSR